MKTFLGSPVLSAFLLGILINQAYSICCPWFLNKDAKCQCDDGGLVHPWECCSEGACNVFCCNCGGPCRQNTTDNALETLWQSLDHRPRRAIPDLELTDNQLDATNRLYHGLMASAMHFANIDEDGDQQLSYDETFRYLSKTKKNYAHRFHKARETLWFNNMDKNRDGHIQLNEFDEDLQQFQAFIGKQ